MYRFEIRSPVADLKKKAGSEGVLRIFNHPKASEDNIWYLLRAATANGVPGLIKLLDEPRTNQENINEVAEAHSLYGERATLTAWRHPLTTAKSLNSVAYLVSSEGSKPALSLLSHPNVPPEEFEEFFRLSRPYPIRDIMRLLDHPKTTKKNIWAVIRSAQAFGIEPTITAWSQPKVEKESLSNTTNAISNQGSDAITLLLQNRKITKDNLAHVANAVAVQGPDAITLLLQNRKITKDNLAHVANAVAVQGPDAITPLIRKRKTTKDNLAQVADAVAKHGVEPTLTVWKHLKTTKDNLAQVADAVAKHGVEPTLTIWKHPRTTASNLSDVAGVASTYGIDNTLAVWNHPKTTGQNLRVLAQVASRYGVEKTLHAWSHPNVHLDSLGYVVQIHDPKKISKDRAHKLLSYTWRDLADGRLDFSKLTPEERLLVTAQLTKASSPENGYSYDFVDFRRMALRHNLNHTAVFTMDKTIPVRVRTAAKPSPEAFKLATHFTPKPLTQQLAYALHQLGHREEYLKRLRAGEGTKEDEAALDTLLKAEKLGSLASPKQTVKRIIHRQPITSVILPLIPEIARQRGYDLSGFDGTHTDENFAVMREFIGDALPEYLGDIQLSPQRQRSLYKLQNRFRVATKGNTKTRNVRLWSGKKAMPHAFYDLLGHTCIADSDPGFTEGKNKAHDPKFSPVTMFDAETGELLGVIYTHKNRKRLDSFGFEPLGSFTDTLADKSAFVQDAYGAVAEAAHRQGLSLHASGEKSEVSNRDALIDIIKAHGKPFSDKRQVTFPEKRIVSKWLDLNHMRTRHKR